MLVNSDSSTKEIFSIKQIEWRFVLNYGSINFNIEMGSANK